LITNLRRIEWALAILVTLALISLHLVFVTHAGGLWRDEANTIGVSTLPTFREFLHWLDFDSFPILWLLIIRAWHAVGLGSDTALRFLGCAVGILLITGLWANARAFRFTFPFFSLVLLGFNSSVIRWGDSIRAYGFGMCMVVLCFASTWLVVQQPTRRHALLAAVVAVLSTQTLYYNSLLLFAISMGGIAVCLRHRWWQRVWLLLGIGAIAALFMLGYIPVFKHSGNWNALFRHEGLGARWYWNKFSQTLSPAGGIAVWIWLGSFLAVFALGVGSLLPKTRVRMTGEQRDVALFSSVALLIGAVAYYLFLYRLRYITEAWYYLAFMAFAAAATDASLSVMVNRPAVRVIRLTFVVTLLVMTLRPVFRDTRIRMTNVDLIASELGKQVDKDDFVLVGLWHDGVSFNRYYRGPAPWGTLPPIEDHRFHRPDLVVPYMTEINQEIALNSLYNQLGQTLKSGHRIWLVGSLVFLRAGERPLILAPAPSSPVGWGLGPYERSWSTQAGYFLELHGTHAEQVPAVTPQRVSEYENLPLVVVSGWNGS